MAPTQKPAQQQNKDNNKNSKSGFVRTRNQNKDIPLSASKIKKRIRDVKRTLTKGKHVSAQVITESKRRLRVLQFELGEKTVDEAERSNATKYHAVKHFERKKTERKVRQAKSALEGESDETKKSSLQQKLDALEIKLLYVLNYPKTLPYVSLYPKENGNDAKSNARKDRVLNDIKNALLAGDKDLQLMNKKYRNEYKDKLIKKGLIDAPVAVDEEVDDKKDDSSSDDSSDEKDDFFEKA